MVCEVALGTGQRHTASGPDVETVDDLEFHRTQGEARGPSPLREWREIGALASKVDELARVWKPDLLHAHSPVLNALAALRVRSEEHTSELQSLMRISYAVFCLKKKKYT